MENKTITCTLCGHAFNPELNPSCGGCPLHDGCSMACCPNCGASNINPAGSRLATWLQSKLQKRMPGGKETKHVESTLHTR